MLTKWHIWEVCKPYLLVSTEDGEGRVGGGVPSIYIFLA